MSKNYAACVAVTLCEMKMSVARPEAEQLLVQYVRQ